MPCLQSLVLFVFDGNSLPDIHKLASQISEEVTNMMNGVGGALTAEQIEAQMEQMLNDLPVMATEDMAGDVPNSMGELLANMAGVMPQMGGAARAAA